MQSKDLLLLIAAEMGKKPGDFHKYVDELDNQMLESIDDLREVSDDQWKQMNFPLGLVNKIKRYLADQSS